MQIDDRRRAVRTLGIMAMVAAGLVLGSPAPALGKDEGIGGNEISTACSVDEADPNSEGEWAVPPMPGRPGEPY